MVLSQILQVFEIQKAVVVLLSLWCLLHIPLFTTKMNMCAGMDSQRNFILPGDLAFTAHHILTSQESSLPQLLTHLYCNLCSGPLKVLLNFVS